MEGAKPIIKGQKLYKKEFDVYREVTVHDIYLEKYEITNNMKTVIEVVSSNGDKYVMFDTDLGVNLVDKVPEGRKII